MQMLTVQLGMHQLHEQLGTAMMKATLLHAIAWFTNQARLNNFIKLLSRAAAALAIIGLKDC